MAAAASRATTGTTCIGRGDAPTIPVNAKRRRAFGRKTNMPLSWMTTIMASGNGSNHRMLLELTRDSKFLMMIGSWSASPPDGHSKTSVGGAAGVFVDSDGEEVYV